MCKTQISHWIFGSIQRLISCSTSVVMNEKAARSAPFGKLLSEVCGCVPQFIRETLHQWKKMNNRNDTVLYLTIDFLFYFFLLQFSECFTQGDQG